MYLTAEQKFQREEEVSWEGGGIRKWEANCKPMTYNSNLSSRFIGAIVALILWELRYHWTIEYTRINCVCAVFVDCNIIIGPMAIFIKHKG